MDERAYVVTKDGELLHYGVKGMKWGVRRAQKKAEKRERMRQKRAAKQLRKDQKAWDKSFPSKLNRVMSDATDYVNKEVIPKVNDKYKNVDLLKKSNYKKYESEINKAYREMYKKRFDEQIGPRPGGFDDD